MSVIGRGSAVRDGILSARRCQPRLLQTEGEQLLRYRQRKVALLLPPN